MARPDPPSAAETFRRGFGVGRRPAKSRINANDTTRPEPTLRRATAAFWHKHLISDD
jgi:hypothetical protein